MRRSRSLLAVAFILAIAATWPLAAAEPQSGTPLVSETVRQLMQDREYTRAIKAIDEAVRTKTGPLDYLNYLKGWALCLAKDHEAAIEALDQVEKQYPQSPWARKARFAKAVAMARTGDFRGAESIYRAESGTLLSAERKQQFAGIYLGYADVFFRPVKPDEQPDYEHALEFYQKALEVGPQFDKRIEVELRVAECFKRLGKTDEAIGLYNRFCQDHPKSPLDVEARYQLGESYLAKKDDKEARRAWQDLLLAHPNSQSERIAEAQFNLAKTWGVPKPATTEDLSLGVASREVFLERFPAHKLAGEAYVSIAQSYSFHHRNDDAARVLTRFLKAERYQSYKEIPEARWLLGKAYQVELKYTDALAAWREFLAKHTSDPRWSMVQQEVVNTEYLTGQEKYDAKQYGEAVRIWSDFLVRYPLDERGADILLKFGWMNFHQKKWDAAIVDWRRLVSKDPGSYAAGEAQWMIAHTLEERLGQFEKAIEEYRKINVGHRILDAAQAIHRLEGKSMSIATERVFRSDETPKIKLTTRNIESVVVRVYKVDLETYFRKMHLARDVAQLNIALIDPDRTWEFKVPGYAKHQQLEREIEVPLPDGLRSGVLAVTVSSKTLEATTLVLQSDLDLIVKTSRDEVFVFAENMRTGKPWPGARLLVSNARQVFAEAITGTDGVLKQSFKELKDADDVRVFGVVEGHVASTTVGLSGVRIAQGLTDKGYLYTDRPAYQPGQQVRLRGCVRHVAGDVYTVVKDRPYTLRILDGRGREVWKESVKLDPFGSFHAEFTLPPTSPQGSYRILADDRDGRSYQGTFQVRQYKIEPVRLSVDAPQRVCYRGEEIQGTIRAAYDYGAPLAGREIAYQLAGDRIHHAKTNEKGEVRFNLPTREFHETQVLPLVVTLPDYNLSTTVNFMLAQQGFSIELSALRPVYLAGETFEVKAKVTDAEGKPLNQKLVLKVLEVTRVEGKSGERPIQEHQLETAADDGSGRKTLKLKKGGTYMVRAEGMDRFRNAVSGELSLQISDEEDQTRLRILADEHTYRVGDTAAVRVHWREASALALVTFQGARVLDYRLVDLKQGENVLSIPMRASLAPNFELSVAVMTDPRSVAAKPLGNAAHTAPLPNDEGTTRPVLRFHHVSSPFIVKRELKVSLSVGSKDAKNRSIRPGGDVVVKIVTTDPQGKPVSAEVSLAMVRQAILEQFAWSMPKIQDYFRGVSREPQFRTESSITFACRPATSPINPRLLAEHERQEIAEAEEASRLAAARIGPAASQAVGGMGGGLGGAFGGVMPDSAKQSATPRTAASEMPAQGGLVARRKSLVQEDADPFAEPSGTPVAKKNVPASQAGGKAAANEKGTRHIAAAPSTDLSVPDSGYWNPSVVTGNDGQATVHFVMPEQSTAWALIAKGITTETLAGETSENFVAKKDLFGQLRLPMAFTDGDQAEIGVLVHNNLADKGPIEVTLKTTIARRTTEEKKTIQVDSKGIQELAFKIALTTPERQQSTDVTFELVVAAGGASDVVRQTVPVNPYGLPAFTAASGSAISDTTVWIEPPKQMSIAAPAMQILVGPTVERSLMDIVAAPNSAVSLCSWKTIDIGTEVERTTSDLMAALALQKLLGGTREAGGPEVQALDGKIRAALASLASSRNDDGGWSWAGRGDDSHPHTTARAVWAISLARAAGYQVPDEVFQPSLAQLRAKVAAADASDLESRAILLHALAAARDRETLHWPTTYTANGQAFPTRRWSIWRSHLPRWIANRPLANCSKCWPNATWTRPRRTISPPGRCCRGTIRPWNCAHFMPWLFSGSPRSRPRPRNWWTGYWPIAPAPAGRPTKPLVRPRWRYACGLPKAVSWASTTSWAFSSTLTRSSCWTWIRRPGRKSSTFRLRFSRRASSESISKSPAADATPINAFSADLFRPNSSRARLPNGSSSGATSRRRWNWMAERFRAASRSSRGRTRGFATCSGICPRGNGGSSCSTYRARPQSTRRRNGWSIW